ncbi:MAG: DUF1385 domain-containing protein [Sporolactobacillus sp.]
MTGQKPIYGGQAVIEGVMMAGQTVTVTAVRRNDQTISYFEYPKQTIGAFRFLKKVPLIRGIVAIMESSAVGSRHLQYASDAYDESPENDEARLASEQSKQKKKTGLVIGLSAIGILSFIFAKFVFDLAPALLASLFEPVIGSAVGQILLEGAIKVALLIGYIALIAETPLIKRLFQYHGAEHKVINTFEAGESLSVENVRKHSRFHYRCGSSFIVFTAIISIFLYLFFPVNPLWLRLVSRLLLIPIDLGLAFEILRLTNSIRHIPILRWLGFPGLSVQLLTTKEPSDDQIEVGIRAFERMRMLDCERASDRQSTSQVL